MTTIQDNVPSGMDSEIMYIWPIGAWCSRLIVELINYFSDLVSIIVIIPIWKRVAGRQSIITPSSYVPKPPIRRSRFDSCQNKQTSALKRRPPMARIGSNFSATNSTRKGDDDSSRGSLSLNALYKILKVLQQLILPLDQHQLLMAAWLGNLSFGFFP
ncbi:MAG: hypothetical protein WBZ20_02095 [Nitrososphaeraceae archaeon]